jgi:hypothetical protein
LCGDYFRNFLLRSCFAGLRNGCRLRHFICQFERPPLS